MLVQVMKKGNNLLKTFYTIVFKHRINNIVIKSEEGTLGFLFLR